MSFLKYLKGLFEVPTERVPRLPVKISCDFSPINDAGECFTPSKKGTIINLSPRGLGLIISPPYSEEYRKTLEEKHIRLKLEFFSLETKTEEKLVGEIRWIKNILDVKKPFSEIGIELLGFDSSMKEDVFLQIFPHSKEHE